MFSVCMRAKTKKEKKGRKKRKGEPTGPRYFSTFYLFISFRHTAKGYICMEILPDVPRERETRTNPPLHFTPGKRLKYLFQDINYD